MNEAAAAKPTGWPTFWFAALALWLFLFAHVIDDVRHHVENLFLLFIVPFLIAAVAASVWLGRLLQRTFPSLALHRLPQSSAGSPVDVGLLCSFIVAALWARSPLFAWFYDSCKIILLIAFAGPMLGSIYKSSGLAGVLKSLLRTAFAAATALLCFVLAALLPDAGKSLLGAVGFIAPIGIPYIIAVALYDCCREASREAAIAA